MNGNKSRENWLRQDQAVVLAGLVGLTAAAWTYMIHLAGTMGQVNVEMAMPHVQAWGGADLALLLIMWVVMMVAMMVPSAAPMILRFAQINSRRDREDPYVPTAAFVLGYLIIWTGFSILATALQWGLHAAALLSPAMASSTPLLGGGILLAAGLFQWTPLKYTCLTQCRSPLGFLMTEWREGTRGALVMGLRHGVYCVGCCSMLMALLFVVGVMNLLWVAAIAGFVLLEKIVPQGQWVSRAAGLLLIGGGVWMVGVGMPLL
ncbi:hypothetical protein BSZ35_00280 [Salinibacter sp. 10B]|uniref:DUF2182 domain-containing protein n=1 Tax=Salinibacter sp. 10B TaxID=1923971 RepID=UPI000CF3643B|nr:DUF2182 domain-containing protein [Salinibacter sp. 10B]PQJ36826.1 hypothetical protein BSZ35_00280 [Salinibacter sp. 10B]